MPDDRRLLLRARAWFGDRWPELFALSFGVAWFFYLGYGPTLDPRSTAWLSRGDWSTYLWGFSFFRRAEWSLPLGNLPNLFYPHGTSVAFTDANPWLSVWFKLWSPLLPLDFQFCGLWFLLCYALQAWFGAKISASLSADRVLSALGGALFATSPVLPVRAQHVALSAIFFVTAGVWLNLTRASDARGARRYALISLFLLVWVAGTHGYLTAMLLALCCAYYVRIALVDKLVSLREGALWAGLSLLVTLATSYLFGYIGAGKSTLVPSGFGEYSADLLALINSQGLSRLVPGLPCEPGQWEGFQYLGLGVLALLALGLGLAIARPQRVLAVLRVQWPLLVISGLMMVYALSSRVTYQGRLVADLSALYAHLWPLPGILRSSGRLGWPLHMMLIAAAVAVVARWVPQRSLARLLLAAALVLEAAEHDRARLEFEPRAPYLLTRAVWDTIGQDYAHLELVPLQLLWDCKPYEAALVDALSYQAYRQNLTFNSGNFMGKGAHSHELCGRGVARLEPRTVYVVAPDYVAGLRAQGAQCGQLDRLLVCVDAGRASALRAALRRTPAI